VYPIAHVTPTVQVDPTATLLGPHAASSTLVAFSIASPGPALHTQCPAVPAHVPFTSHMYVAGVVPAAAVSPPPHVVVTLHVAPAATMVAPHAATPCVAPPLDATVNATLQAQTGAVPLHVPAVASQLHVDPAAAIGDSPELQVVVTVHVAPPTVVAPHNADTVCVAPAVAATVSAGQ